MDIRLKASRLFLRAEVLFAIIVAVAVSSSAQSGTSSPTPTPQASSTSALEKQFFKNILRDQRAIWTSPIHLRSSDIRWLVPLGGTSAALISTDKRTAGALSNDETRLNISRGISYGGSLYTAGAIAGGFYLIGRQTGNARAKETGLLSAEALLDGVIVYSVIKAVTQRPRPREDNGRGRFFKGGESFPSGHAVNAWTVATVIASEYKHRPTVRYGAYGLAALVSISRFTGRKHFLSDVLVGSAIGYGIGRYVYCTRHDSSLDGGSRTTRTTSSKFPLIVPLYNPKSQTYGMSVRWNY